MNTRFGVLLALTIATGCIDVSALRMPSGKGGGGGGGGATGGGGSGGGGGVQICGASCRHPVVFASGERGPTGIAVDSESVYWGDSEPGSGDYGAIRKVLITGGTPTTLVNTGLNPGVITVNGSYVYYVEIALGGAVARVAVQGGAPFLFATDQQGPGGLAVDWSHVYWSTHNGGQVFQAPLAGGSSTLFQTGLIGPGTLAVNGTSLYWANRDGGSVMMASLAGGPPVTLATGQVIPTSILLDSTFVYWLSETTGEIFKMGLGGGSPTSLVRVPGATIMVKDAHHLFLPSSDGIVRVPLSGGSPEQIVSAADAGFGWIAVDDSAIYWTDWAGGRILKVAKPVD